MFLVVVLMVFDKTLSSSFLRVKITEIDICIEHTDYHYHKWSSWRTGYIRLQVSCVILIPSGRKCDSHVPQLTACLIHLHLNDLNETLYGYILQTGVTNGQHLPV